ncbi:MAG: outer membrane beta-barrel protein [Dysgonamonadaceae bacterium]|jgi:hypothetical protein|nr:outer membrane beta-barrel protein [Dysgonamonadaceae bacterium]
MKTTNTNREEDSFNRIIRNKLTNYSISIEEDSWEELEKSLNALPRKKTPLWPWLSGFSVAASIALAFLFSHHTKELDYDNTAQVSGHAEGVTAIVLAEENLSSARFPGIQMQPAQQLAVGNETSVQELAFHEPDVAVTEQTVQTETELPVTEENNKKEQLQSDSNRRIEVLQREEPFISSRKSKKKTGSFGLHISSGGGLYALNNTLNTVNADYSMLLRSQKFEVNASPSLSNDILGPDDFGKISHRPPISAGLSIRKTITDYLSVESGLTYTYLYSTFENKVPQRNASLALHYLGIPVHLVVDFLPRSRSPWNFYLSAGGMVEKGLLAHYVQNTYTPGNDVVVHTNISNEKIDGLQWSVQAALGVSYRFSRTYSLFIEPKISYYLDNNQPFNSRTEHPLAPGINIGLRHTW